jgi:hypothetical protein
MNYKKTKDSVDPCSKTNGINIHVATINEGKQHNIVNYIQIQQQKFNYIFVIVTHTHTRDYGLQ